MRPRTLGKIVVAAAMLACLAVALIFALEGPRPEHYYKSLRAITYAIMSLTFATVYRYFED
jgi:hypothetical protein